MASVPHALAFLSAALSWLDTAAYTPYSPTGGWTYFLEAARGSTWPQCNYRFLSYPDACTSIDLWQGAGGNQEFTLVPVGNGHFYLRTKCDNYVSISGDCNSVVVDTWPQAGINQEFELVDTHNFEWYIRAVGRQAKGCDKQWLSFPGPCTTSGPDLVDLWSGAGENQRFRLHAVRSDAQHNHVPAANGGCADPFVWRPSTGGASLVCTGGDLALYHSNLLGPSAQLSLTGSALGGAKPGWAQNGNRWAPENIEFAGGMNALFFADETPTSGGKHRIGWAMSSSGSPGSWTQYSSDALDLGGQPGGDIDAHAFRDTDGKTYLVWKTDDNSVGAAVTRIWAQEMVLSPGAVSLIGERRVIMDSTGLWWVDSWVAGGSLVEGPEIIKVGATYYLFFAAGRYCQDSYSEGVARSSSIWGPYEKLSVPVLSTGLVGHAKGQKLVGPGHASLAQDASGQWYIMWHANPEGVCDRWPYLDRLVFRADGWPQVDFADSLANRSSAFFAI